MKYCILVVLINFFGLVQGQNANENMKNIAFSNPFHSSSQQYLSILNNKKATRILDDYLDFDLWESMEVLDIDNNIYVLDSANYFIPERKILFFLNGEMLELYADQVQKAKIGNRIFIPMHHANEKNRNLEFYEHVDGDLFKILKSKLLKEEVKNVHPMGLNTSKPEIVVRTKFFYCKENSNIAIPIPSNKLKFLKIFTKHKNKVLKIINKRNLSHKVENDLILISRYYNSLLK